MDLVKRSLCFDHSGRGCGGFKQSVFVKDQESGFLRVSVEKNGTDKILVQYNDGSRKEVDRRETETAMPSKYDGLECLNQMPVFSSATVLWNLKTRVEQDLVYTDLAGKSMVFVNLKKPISKEDGLVPAFRSVESAFNLPPHIYGLAKKAFAAMKLEDADQFMIFLGEEKSGKSHNVSKVLEYFGLSELKESIMKSLNNASKTIYIQFDKSWSVCGAKVEAFHFCERSVADSINMIYDKKSLCYRTIALYDFKGLVFRETNTRHEFLNNYYAEKLNFVVNSRFFDEQQESYKREGLSWNFIDFGMSFHSDSVSLCEGISSENLSSCDASAVLDKLKAKFAEKNRRFNFSPFSKDRFAVDHFVGEIWYSLKESWESKEMEAKDRELFESLLDQIPQSPFVVLCLNASVSDKPAYSMSGRYVLEQLDAYGILERGRMGRKGWEWHLKKEQFVRNFYFHVPKATKHEQWSKELMSHVSSKVVPSLMAEGRTCVFMNHYTMAEIESINSSIKDLKNHYEENVSRKLCFVWCCKKSNLLNRVPKDIVKKITKAF